MGVRRDRGVSQRISGSDAGFLYVEGDSQTSTCTHAVVLAPPGPRQEPLTREGLRDHLALRLRRTPAMTRVLQHVPGGIGHALLVDHPGFDLDAAVEHAVLPAPGGDEEYHAWVADRLAPRLDPEEALWRVTLLDGLAGGRQALVFAFHHTLADGAGLLATLAELLDDAALARATPATPHELAPHPRRRPTLLLLHALARQLVVLAGLPLLVVRTVRRFRRTRLEREAAPVAVPAPAGAAPRSVLNASADARRAFARTSLHLDDLRRVRRAADGASGEVRLSDVVLTVVAGALRRHLAERGELPEVPLVVNVPVGHDAPGAPPRLSGNVFVNYYAHLPTDVADARHRLRAAAAYTAEARRQLEIQGRDTLTTWLDRIPPCLGRWGAAAMARKHRTGQVDPDFNVLVSNLRVRQARWTMRGREVEEVIFSGPVADGAGLNVTVVGQGDRLVVAVQSNPAAVPDPAGLAALLHDALDELLAAYAEAPNQVSPGRVA